MLTIPDNIKELLNTDSIKKNIRIHFPNGERSDICNDQIVKDTVEFTESLCSQSKFKFGLYESSIFECEVVGVSSIKGSTIEVWGEIYCDPTVDGAVFREDLQAYVYPIPYGVFIVDSSKRKSDTIYRNIVAYTESTPTNWKPTEFEQKKVSNKSEYEYNLGYFLAANNFYLIDEVVDVNDVGVLYSQDIEVFHVDTVYHEHGGDSCHAYFDRYAKGTTSYNCLYQIENVKNYEHITRAYLEDELRDFLKVYLDMEEEYIRTRGKALFSISIDYLIKLLLDNGYTIIYPGFSGNYRTSESLFYPNINFSDDFTQSFSVNTSTNSVTLVITDVFGTVLNQKTIDLKPSIPKIFQHSYKNNAPQWTNLKVYIKGKYYGTNFLPSFDDFDIKSYVDALAELMGVFLWRDRSNELRMIDIKQQFDLLPSQTLYPNTSLLPLGAKGGILRPENYQQCAYDDEYSKPAGAVSCQYTNKEDTLCEYILYISGFDANSDPDSYSTYQLNNNALIKADKWNESDIQSYCEVIAENIKYYSYIPVEFIGRGLPYVEPGDTFQILSKINDSITTIVLNRTLKGEQCLIDTYKTV